MLSSVTPWTYLDWLHVVVRESQVYKHLKGHCLINCRATYMMLNVFLPK